MFSSRPPPAPTGHTDSTDTDDVYPTMEIEPEQVDPNLLGGTKSEVLANRLIIAVDFGTTYSSVSYVPIPGGCSPNSVDPSSIRSIQNYPSCWNYNNGDQMLLEVPTEVIYPLNRRFRDEDDQDLLNQQSGYETNPGDVGGFIDPIFGFVPLTQGNGNAASNVELDLFRWGYQVHELWSLPATHSDDTIKPLSRFKLLLDQSPHTKAIRDALTPILNELETKRIVKRPATEHVIADFLTYLLKHVQSELHNEGYDDSYHREIVLCVPAIWTQKACRQMQASMAFAMQRANFQGVDLQNNSIEDLFIVSEPEAAAEYVLCENSDFDAGDVFVLLDAGGGTVDANTYEISNQAPLRLSREVVPPGGGLFGSSYLNEAFRRHLKSALSEETYLERESETIDGIVEKVIMDSFEYRIKRTFDCFLNPEPKLFAISGLRDNPKKNFRRGAIKIHADDIKAMFHPCLVGIASQMEHQIITAAQQGFRVDKVILIGGFAASVSLQKYLEMRLAQYNKQNGSQIKLVKPEHNVANAVASGAVLRALNKEQGPQREARSSYGILRSEPFMEHPDEHRNLKPYYDTFDGQPYIMNTIDWVLKLGTLVPPVWECNPFLSTHNFDAGFNGPLICREVLYVSDRSTKSHYRKSHPNNDGAEKVGEIIVDFSFLRDEGLIQPTEPTVDEDGKKVGRRHYKINYTMVLKVVDRDLTCYAIYDGTIRQRCRINIASGFRPGVK